MFCFDSQNLHNTHPSSLIPYPSSLIALLLALLLLAAARPAGAQATVAEVTQVQGVAEVQRKGTAAWVTLRRGSILQQGDRIRTQQGQVILRFREGGRSVQLASHTELEVTQPSRLRLFVGKVLVWLLGHRPTEVSAHGAVAAVEGTAFLFEADEQGTVQVTVRDGRVRFFNERGRVVVGPGQRSSARPDAAPTPPVPVDVGDLPLEPEVEAVALDLGMDDPQGRLSRSVARMNAGNLQGAAETLAGVLADTPESAPAWACQALLELARGDLDAARTAAERAVAFSPPQPPDAEDLPGRAAWSLAREARGTVRTFAGQFEEAEADLRAALDAAEGGDAEGPRQARDGSSTYLALARALAGQDRLDEAVAAAETAVAGALTRPAARTTLGVLYLAAHDWDRAEREFRRVLELTSPPYEGGDRGGVAEATTGLSVIAARRGDFAAALCQQEAALALDATLPAAHNNLGALYLAQGRLNKAVAEFSTAHDLQPTWGRPLGNLALAYLEQNRFAAAVQAAEEAVRLGERSAVLRTTLARVYRKQGRDNRALAELRVAEELDPDFPLTHFQLADLYLDQNRPRAAVREVLRATTLDPGAMVESRQYARAEGRSEYRTGTDNSRAAVRWSGRADEGRVSYYANFEGQEDTLDRPANDDWEDGFWLGMAGYQPDPTKQWLLYTSAFHRAGGRPGRTTLLAPEPGGEGGVEDVDYRSRFDGAEAQLVHRLKLAPERHLTLKVGTRGRRLHDTNPDSLAPDPFTAPDQKPFRSFTFRTRETLAEARWDHTPRPGQSRTLGLAWRRERRTWAGNLGRIDFSGPEPDVEWEPFRISDRPETLTFYAEQEDPLSARLSLTLGVWAGHTQGNDTVGLPKVALRGLTASGARWAFVAQPLFRADSSELSPTESWSQPHGFDLFDLGDGGGAMDYELHYEQPGQRASLLRLSAFARRANGLLLDLDDPAQAPAATRLEIGAGQAFGGQVDYEQWLTNTLSGNVWLRWQGTEDRDTGQDLPYHPAWEGGLRFDYLDREGWRASLSGHYVGRRFAGLESGNFGDPTAELPSYVRFDARLTKQEDLHRAFFLEVSNLLDKRYEPYLGYPAPGRRVWAGIEYRW